MTFFVLDFAPLRRLGGWALFYKRRADLSLCTDTLSRLTLNCSTEKLFYSTLHPSSMFALPTAARNAAGHALAHTSTPIMNGAPRIPFSQILPSLLFGQLDGFDFDQHLHSVNTSQAGASSQQASSFSAQVCIRISLLIYRSS